MKAQQLLVMLIKLQSYIFDNEEIDEDEQAVLDEKIEDIKQKLLEAD